MATVDDVEVANASFPNVRQDLNDILEALATNFSADAEPTTMYPSQFWYENDTNLLYLRNEDNDAWITLAFFDQTNDEWEVRTGVVQAANGDGLALKTDEGTTRVEIADDGSVTVNTSLDVDNIKIDGNTISSTDTNGDINITPDGTGKVVIDGLNYPTADGTDGQVLTTDGSGNIAFEDAAGGAVDKIEEGNSSVEVVDTGTGHVAVTVDGSETARFEDNGRLGIGTTTPGSMLTIEKTDTADLLLESTLSTNTQLKLSAIAFGTPEINVVSNHGLIFKTNNTEHMRIDSSGNVLVGKTSTSIGVAGAQMDNGGSVRATRDSAEPMFVNRLTNDGNLVNFYQDTVFEGSISVSGTTVSYNGGHLARWSRLTDDSKDTSIVKGTVMTNLDEMVVWSHDAVEEVLDEKGSVITEAKEAYTEENEQLNKMAVSSVEGDPNVAGVFVNWDNDDDEFNDMNIAMTGDMVIRIAQGTSVARGDLLMSAGDGTAKPQGDDIVRSKTIAKVTSTHVSHTYDDGSYLVPCVLMAC